MKGLLCAAMMVALLCLTACGGSSESPSSPTTTTAATTATTVRMTTTTAPRTRALVTVPEIQAGEAADEVVARLEAVGLFAQKLEVRNYDVPNGTVVRTEPAYPQQVTVGSSITLLVSYW